MNARKNCVYNLIIYPNELLCFVINWFENVREKDDADIFLYLKMIGYLLYFLFLKIYFISKDDRIFQKTISSK